MTKQAHKRNSREAVWRAVAGVLGVLLLIWALLPLLRHILNVGVAALGAAGAARLLLTGNTPETVALRTPKGIVVEVAPLFCRKTDA